MENVPAATIGWVAREADAPPPLPDTTQCIEPCSNAESIESTSGGAEEGAGCCCGLVGQLTDFLRYGVFVKGRRVSS